MLAKATADSKQKAGGKYYQNNILVGIVLLLAGTSIAIVQYKVPTILGDIMVLFAMSASEASWLMSIFTLVGVFIAIPTGGLAQRFGPKVLMIVASGIVISGSLIGAFAGTSMVLIISRAIEGVALTVVTACGPIAVQKCVRQERIGGTMGIWGIWGCLGSAIAGVLTPTIFGSWGFQAVWIIYAGITLVAAVLLLVFIHIPKSESEMAINIVSQKPLKETLKKPRYREILTPNTIFFYMGFAIFNICLLAILSYVPTILQMQGFGATLSGFISTLPMLLSIVSSPLFGALSDRLGRCKPLLLTSMAVIGPCSFILYTNTGLLMWVAVFVMGLVGMGTVGLSLASYMKILPRPELVSIGMGVMVLVQGVGQFLGTYTVQGLLGPSLTNWFTAGVVIMILGLVGTGSIALCRFR